ncbi:MAG TPA: M50 family metallopeptidase [Kofleriaceae bacterium]|nr:M50 family metallopeptidase [Kofleriaceae bacterium]
MTSPTPTLRPLALTLIASVLLWQLPFGGFLLYPFKLLGTWLHEGSHALTMALTGASVDRMEVFADGSGLAHARYPVATFAQAVIAAAGYMGTPLWGVALLAASRTVRGARWALATAGVLLLSSTILLVANRFGQVALSLTGALVVLGAVALPARWTQIAAHVLAAQACINAVVDIRVLYRPMLYINGKAVRDSDAHAMAQATFGTDANWAVWLWASIWIAWSLALLGWVFTVVRRRDAATHDGPRTSDLGPEPEGLRPRGQ